MNLYARLVRFVFEVIRPFLGIWFGHRLSRRVRVAVRCGDELLLVRTSLSSQHPALPGGGIKQGESAVEAALRELHEETGLRAIAEQMEYIGEMKTVQSTLPFHITLFQYSVESKTLPSLHPFRHLEILERHWVPVADISSNDPVLVWYLNRDQFC